ncbi:acyl-CoA thioesterase [Cohaesibacter sp. CAU 1516]|uniref:acyl-CoA thioesterase n=1 Tax=Cohaesibacter sp. CAU 1516 TaxID=2576038 RepID=UPI0010FE4616|nr:acyl-CoA thioesterase [Cohaesibacter sp. CAU 1516]TLP45695.1 acyl-CoA thioesterase [Cohaesibacter sp. CAU 1516]
MYPVSRLLLAILEAKRGQKKQSLAFDAVSEISFRCRPWDLDMFMEMNNGRVLTLYDLGRFDLSIRCGLMDVLKRQKWGLAVAGSSVRYRKRVRLFDKVTMRSQVVGMDERWFYIAQSMWVAGEPTSSVLLRTCITARGRSIPTAEVRTAIGAPDWQLAIPDWVTSWNEADKIRPWPPAP